MNWFKKVLVLFFSLLLMVIVFFLVINCTLKDILVESIIKENIKTQVMEQLKTDGKIPDDEKVNEIMESEEISNLLDKYLDYTINGVVDEENLEDVDVERDILKFLQDNKEVLEKEVGAEITDQMINDAVEKLDTRELTKSYKEAVKETSNNMTTSEKSLIKNFKYFLSEKFRIILIIAAVVTLLIIALIEWSFYKWLKALSIVLIVNSICFMTSSFVIDTLAKAASNVTIKMSNLLVVGIGLLIGGIVCYILYKVIDVVLKKKEEKEIKVNIKDDEDEVSKMDEE